ncbi:hypothetical protein EPN90_01390 [Patescibacteria group bacterium]|nr:MAG: hypothetical protein EPN90_01390 [Patescibacteria group bacterium]
MDDKTSPEIELPVDPSPKRRHSRRFLLGALAAGALLIAALNGGGHLLMRQRLAAEGRGYYPYALTYQFDNTNMTGPRLREILDGHWLVTDFNLSEKKGWLFYWPPLPPLLFWPLTLFTRNIINLVILGDFVFPALFFLIFFFLYNALSHGKKWPAFCFALLTSLYVYFSLHFPPLGSSNLKAFLKSAVPFDIVGAPDPYLFSRRKEAFVPALLPLLLTFLFAYRAAAGNKKRPALVAGLFLALNAYSYPFHFIYAATSFGLLFIFAALRRRRALVKQLLILFASAFIFLVPFALNQTHLLALPHYREFVERNGLEVGRAFRLEHWPRYAWLLAVSVLLFFAARKRPDEKERTRALFLVTPLLAGIIDWNLQVILGFSVQSDHWLDRDIFLGLNLAYFVLFLWLWTRVAAKSRRSKFLAFSFLIIFLVSVAATQVRGLFGYARENYRRAVIPDYLTRQFTWLDQNIPAEAVVMTPSLVNNVFLPLYTSANIFVPRGLGSLASEEETLERLFITYRVFGIGEGYLEQALTPPAKEENSYEAFERSAIGYLFATRYQSRSLTEWTRPTGEVRPIPEGRYREILAKFQAFRCDNCLKKYRVDYLLYGPNEKKIVQRDFSLEPFLRQVYDDGETQIFQVIAADGG